MTEIERTLAKFFKPDMLTKVKRRALESLADKILSAKNDWLLFSFNDFEYFFVNNITKYSFNSYLLSQCDIMLPSQVKTEAVEDVFTKLKQRKDLIKDKLLNLNLQRIGGVEYYQKAVKHGDYTVQPGAVKEVKYKKYKTELSIFVATMSLFSEDTEESMKHGFGCYINRNLEELYNELKEVPEKYKKIEYRIRAEKRINKSIEHFNGFMDKLNDENLFSRCFRLSRSRRERIFNKYNSEPIVLNNRNFRGRSKVCDFIDYNRNSIEKYKKTGKYSKINSFLNLGGICPGWKHLYIPIKHCKNYHGNLSDYRKNADTKFFNYQYIVIFKENGELLFQIAKKVTEKWPEVTDDMTVIGGDQNMKHNLEVFSDGFEIDWPRKHINELVKTEIRLDETRRNIKNREDAIKCIKRNNEELNQKTSFSNLVSEIKQLKNTEQQLVVREKKSKRVIKADVDRELNRALKHFIEEYGTKVHIALEDIDGKFSKCRIKYKTADGTEYSQNKLFRQAHFGEVKDRFKRICQRYGVPVSFIPAYYTSQICPECGHIDRDNRRTQETLECVNCGAVYPADSKSSKIISILPQVAVLRESLLEPDGFGAYAPKKNLKKETVKKIYKKYGYALVS